MAGLALLSGLAFLNRAPLQDTILDSLEFDSLYVSLSLVAPFVVGGHGRNMACRRWVRAGMLPKTPHPPPPLTQDAADYGAYRLLQSAL